VPLPSFPSGKSLNLGLALLLASSLFAQLPSETVASVGDDAITVQQFAHQYAPYLARADQPDHLSTRLAFLDSLIAASMFQQYSVAAGLAANPTVLAAGYEAWRHFLFHEVAKVHFQNGKALSMDPIDEEYRYRSTLLNLHYLTLPDSLAALEYLGKLKEGAPFEVLALRTFVPENLLDRPWEPGWRYTYELDSSLARTAYTLAPGDFSLPIKTSGGYAIAHLLGKNFQPNHGHFERVGYQQQIAAELEDVVNTHAARVSLERWAAELRIKWRWLATRRVLKSRILNSPEQVEIDSLPPKLLSAVPFKIEGRSYNLEWILTRLELLPPDRRHGIIKTPTFREMVRELLLMDRLVAMVLPLPPADAILAAADNLRNMVIQTAIEDSIRTMILSEAVPSDDDLRLYLAAHPQRYALPALVKVDELVLREGPLAAVLKDSLDGGADFQALARQYSERPWGKVTGGRLGWVRLDFYGAQGDSLTLAPRNEWLGPFTIDGHSVLLRVHEVRPYGRPSFESLQSRLRHDWIADHKDQLIDAWVNRMRRTTYPTTIDTALLASTPVGGESLPVAPQPALP